ncbi:AlpA family transcriptional regulator [Providencia rettgeri]|uniref:helix-turn-helix transcriptional regulator n=1 Tax=Morganellaceae TaxID=1903414 RepID=UPI000BA145D1|nr:MULTISPECIES: AlpA family transcriptional regulator [Morganellaceae]HDH9217411.1 AlpA family transcriptional regulator [Escherichia coli]MBN7840126.1 AlpA family transcriptional regulator [Providencia rettgeri]MBN7853054.1 AlpA family transcriptional regulator [Providencia rettgeri]MBN7861141.1 AlpA family transcriptional regulator [Providencia rettgeri]MBN7871398.1 AlpA family transcriptional regulator [Providencia rettgeri]
MPIVIPLQENLIRLPEVMRRTGYGKAWIYVLISRNEFPKPVKIGSRSIAFVESEIDRWVLSKITKSRAMEVV